ncbi:MAG: hypothetical protein IT340_19080 [Chloroflexi bacterium]|nr:hypothetical protein [Chloroflexota bacterium]
MLNLLAPAAVGGHVQVAPLVQAGQPLQPRGQLAPAPIVEVIAGVGLMEERVHLLLVVGWHAEDGQEGGKLVIGGGE